MKVALVHDYLKEYGGAERALEALCEIYPAAPIYTAFMVKDSGAGRAFAGREIITSWANGILQWKNLFSPLRFLTPLIWESFNLSNYDLIISSASWYITKSIITKPETVHICYCHTPPRWLYGYQTSREWKKFWPVRVYGEILAHWLRQYDYLAAQRVGYFIANSKETQERIKKFYRRDSIVIYPPVDLKWEVGNEKLDTEVGSGKSKIQEISLQNPASHFPRLASYFLVVSRLSGAKNIDLAISACNQLKKNLWVVGGGHEEQKLRQTAGSTIKFLGEIDDEELAAVYRGCKALLATAVDEDFGITPGEAMSFGKPVIAYRGGGYLETVVDGKTGLFFDELTVESLTQTIKCFDDLNHRNKEIDKINIEKNCLEQAKKFGKERFKKEIINFVNEKMKEHHA